MLITGSGEQRKTLAWAGIAVEGGSIGISNVILDRILLEKNGVCALGLGAGQVVPVVPRWPHCDNSNCFVTNHSVCIFVANDYFCIFHLI